MINWIYDKLVSIKQLIDKVYQNNHDFNYSIIQYKHNIDRYVIQCNKTSNSYHVTFDELISDTNLLSQIHPAQTCYLGIANCNNQNLNFGDMQLNSTSSNYQIHSFTRSSDICLLDKTNNKLRVLSLEQLIHTNIVSQLDALQSLYIGATIGRQLSINNA